MASRWQYRRTGWGAQWLQALTQIDHENRLPRGRAHASRGAVRDLVIDGGPIHARVQGSRPRPYEVNIDVPAVAAADAACLVERLAADVGLIARLRNRELDPVVLQEAQRMGSRVDKRLRAVSRRTRFKRETASERRSSRRPRPRDGRK